MSKKTALIIISIAVLLIIGGLLWFYFFYGRTPPVEPPSPGTFPAVDGSGGTRGGSGAGGGAGSSPEIFAEPRLRLLSSSPVAGAISVIKGSAQTVRFVDRASGNVFEVSLSDSVAVPTRLTNATIPKVYEALWQKGGERTLLRYLKDDEETIDTFSGHIRPKSGGGNELIGGFLPANIKTLAVSPDGSRLFYLKSDESGVLGVRSGFDGSSKVEAWESPVREWLATWPKGDTVALTSKPSATFRGILLFLNPQTGESDKILSGKEGLLTAVSPSTERVLYSSRSGNGVSAFLYERKTRSEERLPVKTLADKCAWARESDAVYCGIPKYIPSGAYPDNWYQGTVSFEDELWKIEASSQNATRVADFSQEIDLPLDILNPFLSEDGNYFIFMNKSDLTLWSLRLKE